MKKFRNLEKNTEYLIVLNIKDKRQQILIDFLYIFKLAISDNVKI